jgi:glycerol-3-phosphate dehydrogenase
VLGLAGSEPALAEVFDPATHAIGAEVMHALGAELATTLEDVLLRRTMVALGPTVGLGPDRAAARLAAAHAGWDESHADAEVEAFRERVRRLRPAGDRVEAAHR